MDNLNGLLILSINNRGFPVFGAARTTDLYRDRNYRKAFRSQGRGTIVMWIGKM
jgi:hypothetical protein